MKALRWHGLRQAGISGARTTIDQRLLILYERSVYGSLGYYIARIIDRMAAERPDASPLLTGICPLTQVPEVFAELAADRDKHLKVLICAGVTSRGLRPI
jgi:(R,R)-butanediol dehydrogenase/meso-butanediol dehydrogenase/diacetyl reductase